MNQEIVVVDDDRFLQDRIKKLLEGSGYSVRTESSAEDGLRALTERTPSLMVLDLGLPGVDGINFCRQIRSKWRFPIIMLTARTDAMDKVIGLEVGADDYLTKPFEPSELLARVRAHLRRANEYADGPIPTETAVTVGSLRIDPDTRVAKFGETELELTAKEFELLLYLSQNQGRALSREIIFETVWGFDPEFNSNSLDVFVYRLRQKLEKCGGSDYLHTVRGYGYKLSA